MSDLKGKVAIVTGGSRGIGRAIVLMLAKNGCHVAFNYQKNDGAALTVVNEAKKLGVKCVAAKVDIKDFVKVKTWVEEVKEKMGRLDILVNNAGRIIDKALMLMDDQDWQDVIDTNLNGVFNATRACIVTFLKQKSGNIVNISSVSGIFGLPRQVNYSAAKGGVNAFTKALAKEVAVYNVKVNAVAPGFVDTDILSNLTEEQKSRILEAIPQGRLGVPEDIANCVKFLLSEGAQYITGQIIQVDGGLAIR